MVGSRAEKHHSSRVGKNWVMMGFCGGIQDGDESGEGNLVGPACFAYLPSPTEPWAPWLSGPQVRSPEHLEAKG